MGKTAGTAAATNAANNLPGATQATINPTLASLGASNTTATNNQQSELGGATAGYTAQQTTGGYDPTQLATLRSNTSGIAATGGYDPTQLAAIQSAQATNVGAAGNIASTGGYDPTQLGVINTGYDSLAANGGFDPNQANQFLESATSGTANTYASLMQQVQQQNAATGGYGGGAETSQMARQLGQAQAANTLNANVSLNQQETANKLAGLGGEASVQQNLAGNELAGVNAGTSATTAEGNLASSVAGAKAGGVQQQQNLEASVAQGIQAASNGLANLYNTTSNTITTQGSQIIQLLGMEQASQADQVAALSAISKNPTVLQNIISGAAQLAGAAESGAAAAAM